MDKKTTIILTVFLIVVVLSIGTVFWYINFTDYKIVHACQSDKELEKITDWYCSILTATDVNHCATLDTSLDYSKISMYNTDDTNNPKNICEDTFYFVNAISKEDSSLCNNINPRDNEPRVLCKYILGETVSCNDSTLRECKIVTAKSANDCTTMFEIVGEQNFCAYILTLKNALTNKNALLCQEIKNKFYKSACLSMLGKTDLGACQEGSIEFWCINPQVNLKNALTNKDESYCNNIWEDTRRAQCLRKVNELK